MSNKSATISLLLRFLRFLSLPLIRKAGKAMGLNRTEVSKDTSNKIEAFFVFHFFSTRICELDFPKQESKLDRIFAQDVHTITATSFWF